MFAKRQLGPDRERPDGIAAQRAAQPSSELDGLRHSVGNAAFSRAVTQGDVPIQRMPGGSGSGRRSPHHIESRKGDRKGSSYHDPGDWGKRKPNYEKFANDSEVMYESRASGRQAGGSYSSYTKWEDPPWAGQDTYIITGHGSPKSFKNGLDNVRYTHGSQLASEVYYDAGYQEFVKNYPHGHVILQSCKTGYDLHGIAQQLATALGRIVYAPTSNARITGSGSLAARKDPSPTRVPGQINTAPRGHGEYLTFHP